MDRRLMDDDLILLPDPVIGQAQAIATDPDEPHPFGGWLYVPDLSSMTGWTSYELHRPEPPQRERHVGFHRRPVIRRGR